MFNRILAFVALGLGTLALTACSDRPDSAPEHLEAPAAATATPLAAGWNTFAPEGETTCSDGTPYRFFVRPGDPEKLLVYLQGGGGCWFRENCDPDMQPSYIINIADDFKPPATGIFNFRNADNPFADYSVVMAPYCTGDVHLGQSDTVYAPVADGQEPLTVRHQGYANVSAALDWTVEQFAAPREVFVTGSSAGAIPSPFYAAILADRYPDAKVAQLGDGAGGYRRMTTDARPNDQWATYGFLAATPGFETITPENFSYEALYIAAAKAHPDVVFAEYDTAEDAVQKRFLALSGTRSESLLDNLNANHADIRAAVPNFRAYIAGGDSHTVLLRPEFYSYASDGVAIRDWVAGLAARDAVADVACRVCDEVSYAGPPIPAPLQTLWRSWEDRETQYVEPFQIFDNVFYVGIDWVAAYVLQTSEGLILIDSLYGSWVAPLLGNLRKLGLDPADIKYVINTHGHFDHAGGSAYLQHQYGARVVMSEQDWALAETRPDTPMFYMPVPERDIVAEDGDVIELGDTRVELFHTPGHTEGVLTLRYTVHDGDDSWTAVTLGGVGLNFSGVARTESYIASYERLQSLQDGVSVSLPNHAAMADVLGRGERLAARKPGEPHPFVDADAYRARLSQFLAAAEAKLVAEKAGTTPDEFDALSNAVSND